MQLVINHLTRMQKGFMCVAGIDPQRRRHIRPVLGQLMPIDMLSEHGGPFALERIVDLGPTRFAGRMPEIEDRWFEAAAARVVGQSNPAAFRELNAALAADRLADVFGPDLCWIERGAEMPLTAAVPEAAGLRSLGCYWAREPHIEVRPSPGGRRVRFCFTDNGRRFDVPVTDIRCFEADHVTPSAPSVAEFQRVLQWHERALTSIGLSRAYRKNPEDPPLHWLQVNNVHLPPA
jgi:hypothetical protein